MKNKKIWFGLAALAAAWLFDFLFWNKSLGVSFLIWVVVVLGLGYVFAWSEKKKLSPWTYVLTGLILALAVLASWRAEPLTHALSMLMTLLGLVLLAATFLNGYWVKLRLFDYVAEFFKTVWAGVTRGFSFLTQKEVSSDAPEGVPSTKKGSKLGAVGLGLLFALPIVLILGLLLVSADPIFGDMVKRVFDIEHLPQYIFRFIYILVIAYVLIGVYLHALAPTPPSLVPDTNKPYVQPFLSAITGNIVLASVDLLFLFFVVIQVQYLFGGQANISSTGYTYSEYARKGFGELVGVAVLSLLLYLVFNGVTKRETGAARISFSVLSILLIANVLVILASSLMRLLMYEEAYGFSQLRTYTHVFIYWLAALLVAAIVLELVHKRGFFGLALVLTAVGYTLTLGLLNVDGFVAAQNVKRTQGVVELDTKYLSSLSVDAVPEMITAYQNPELPAVVHDELGNQLSCRVKRLNYEAPDSWQGTRFGYLQAAALLKKDQSSWASYDCSEYK